jgi:predicted aspartyl protease
MGKVTIQIRLTNAADRILFEQGHLNREDQVRRYEMKALVDTSSVMLALPQDVVEHLGLPETGHMTVVYANDVRGTLPVAGPLFVEVLGREMPCDCVVLPPASEALIGQIIMERLDLIVDCLNQTISARPESPLRPMLDLK